MTIETFKKQIWNHYNIILKQTGKTSYLAKTPNGLLLLFAHVGTKGRVVSDFEIFGGSYTFTFNLNGYKRWNKEVFMVIDKAYCAMMTTAIITTDGTNTSKKVK